MEVGSQQEAKVFRAGLGRKQRGILSPERNPFCFLSGCSGIRPQPWNRTAKSFGRFSGTGRLAQ
jgi:hypothetical protein